MAKEMGFGFLEAVHCEKVNIWWKLMIDKDALVMFVYIDTPQCCLQPFGMREDTFTGKFMLLLQREIYALLVGR